MVPIGPAWTSQLAMKWPFWSNVLGEWKVKMRYKEHLSLSPSTGGSHTHPGSRCQAFLLHLCEQIAMPTGGFILIVKFLMSVWRSCGALKMICYTSFREFYSQNSTVLWNPHLNELHDLWKVRMLTPALQIDKLCPKFITGGLLEVREWVSSGTFKRIQMFCPSLTLWRKSPTSFSC